MFSIKIQVLLHKIVIICPAFPNRSRNRKLMDFVSPQLSRNYSIANPLLATPVGHASSPCDKKKRNDYIWEVLKCVKRGGQKYWVFNNSSNIVIKSVGFMTVPAFKYCVLQWSFSEMLDSPTQNCHLLPYISESLPQQKNSWIFFPRNSPATNVSQIVSWQLPLATYPPHATIVIK